MLEAQALSSYRNYSGFSGLVPKHVKWSMLQNTSFVLQLKMKLRLQWLHWWDEYKKRLSADSDISFKLWLFTRRGNRPLYREREGKISLWTNAEGKRFISYRIEGSKERTKIRFCLFSYFVWKGDSNQSQCFLITWDKMQPLYRSSCYNGEVFNQFQVAIIWDENHTFIFINYEHLEAANDCKTRNYALVSFILLLRICLLKKDLQLMAIFIDLIEMNDSRFAANIFWNVENFDVTGSHFTASMITAVIWSITTTSVWSNPVRVAFLRATAMI